VSHKHTCPVCEKPQICPNPAKCAENGTMDVKLLCAGCAVTQKEVTAPAPSTAPALTLLQPTDSEGKS
jgi:hypothetical protein